MIGVIIQARMGSKRLPGKTMYKVNGKPLLHYSVERVAKAKYVDKVIVATTTSMQDDEIYNWCIESDVVVYRGSEEDVLDRYYQAACENELDIIIRVTSDCPFVDPCIIDMLITNLLNYNCDYVSNRWKTRSWPHGLDVEVFKKEALLKAWKEGNKPYEREHVTPYILEHDKLFKIKEIPLDQDLSHIRLTVDYPEDMNFVQEVIPKLLQQYNINYTWEQVLKLLQRQPSLAKINAEVINTKMY